MTSKQPRQVNAEEVRTLARIAGVEIAPERLEQLAEQNYLSALYSVHLVTLILTDR